MYLVNDQLVSKENVHISPEDRGYYFGDGVYEVFRVYNGTIFEKKAHLDRLQRSAREVRIPLPFSLEQIGDNIERLLEKDGVSDGTLYLQITRGEAPRAHAFPPAGTPPVVMAYTKEVRRPLEQLQNGIATVTLPDIRWLRCDIKTLNLLANVLAKQEAVERGGYEALLHREGRVTECSSSNVMMVKNGTIYTHPANNLILHGITRAVVLRLAAGAGIPVLEEAFDLDALREADEVFITGTTVEAMPVVTVDGRPVADGQPGPVTRRLQAEFEAYAGL